MKRILRVVAVAGLVLAGAACSSTSAPVKASSDAHPATDTATTDTGSTDTGSTDTGDTGSTSLSDQLLTSKDLPKGWKATGPVDTDTGSDSADSADSDTPKCLHAFNDVTNPGDQAKIKLEYGDRGIPVLEEDLGAFGDTAQSTYDELDRAFSGCGEISFTDDSGDPVTGTIEPLDIGDVGAPATAYTLLAQSKGITVGLDLALVHKGDTLAFVVLTELGKPDTKQFTSILRKAAGKID